MPRVTKYDENDEPISGYRLVDFLGAGQFGEVWKAVESDTGKRVALKLIDLSHSHSALKELKALNLVKNLNHPHLIPIFTARVKDKNNREIPLHLTEGLQGRGVLRELVIAMGLGEKSLSARLKELNPYGTDPAAYRGLPVGELLGYMQGAAKGIDFLNKPDHGLGVADGPIVHCDIKPDNLMIVAGEIQITDCGVAVIITPDVRQTKAAGSPAYSAPELTGNKPVPGTDQYALAISYYELRTGHLPFDEKMGQLSIMLAHAEGRLDFSSPVISEAEHKVLKWATAVRPRERYPTCADMVRQLERAVAGLEPIAPPQTVTRPIPRVESGSIPSMMIDPAVDPRRTTDPADIRGTVIPIPESWAKLRETQVPADPPPARPFERLPPLAPIEREERSFGTPLTAHELDEDIARIIRGDVAIAPAEIRAEEPIPLIRADEPDGAPFGLRATSIPDLERILAEGEKPAERVEEALATRVPSITEIPIAPEGGPTMPAVSLPEAPLQLETARTVPEPPVEPKPSSAPPAPTAIPNRDLPTVPRAAPSIPSLILPNPNRPVSRPDFEWTSFTGIPRERTPAGRLIAHQVFISYRRGDSDDITNRMIEFMNKHFAKGVVFFDLEDIDLGDRFPEVIGRAVSSCKVFIAVIGKDWLNMLDDDGQRRLDDPLDFVRLEIEAALQRDIRVIPVLVREARMPKQQLLPESLMELAIRHGMEVRSASRDFQNDMRFLIEKLTQFLNEQKRER
jgi:serine/threonine protein kinase